MHIALTLVALFAIETTPAQAAGSLGSTAGNAARAHPAQATGFGSPGNARDVTRVVDVSLRDTMRIDPGQMSVSQGETLRLRISNAGKVAHEFVLGTQKEIFEHRNMMRTMPTMKSDDANAVSVAPGRTAELVWRFSEPGTFLYACLLPGHWEAGMQGTVTVGAAAKSR